jgi:hypothetical protein
MTCTHTFKRGLRLVISLSAVILSGAVTRTVVAENEASELKIVDRSGLARLVAQIHEAETVEVHLATAPSEAQGQSPLQAQGQRSLEAQGLWSLVHVDGLSPSVKGEVRTNSLILFPKVSAGTWRLTQVPPSAVKVQDVKLLKSRD